MNRFFSKYKNFLFVLVPFGFLWAIKPLMPSWFFIPPKSCLGGCGSIEGMIPFVGWINTGIKFLKSYEIFGLFTFREFTRSISKGIDSVLNFTEAIFYNGFENLGIEPLPWIMLFGLANVYGLYLRGWR